MTVRAASANRPHHADSRTYVWSMAGGFGGKGAPLHARTRATPPPTAATKPDAGPDVVPPGSTDGRALCPARHCWVTATTDGGSPRPGLLLEWRRGDRGWEGRVVYAAELRRGRWAAVEEWLPAEAVASVEPTTAPHPRLRSES